MNILEKEHDYKEEHFDFIQQALRIICLHYGAALFYTSTHRPRTTALLRAYILSRLLHSTHSSAPMSARFPFNYRAQIIERDTIMIPAGWDSWGKVQALREDFECRVMADAWQIDESNSTEAAENGLHAIYRKRVRDTTATIKSVATKEPVVAEDEQEFLARLREMLQSSSITEKTSAHSISTTTTTTTTTTASTSTLLGRLPFTVGEAGGEQRSEANDNPMSRLTELAHSRLMSSSANSATSPTSASSPPSQNEVLASFFQSLLTKKSGSSAASSRAKKVAESLARTKNNQ
jgi:dynein light intermediate chain 1